jgi:bifunctional UDP-N-acetylglucosamine pyrophosphorylase/glucosamine-1-phosphate N-acetyltransferase
MPAAIILAGGKGTRMNSKSVNKVITPFFGKPIIQYGVDLFSATVKDIVIVVGAYSESVKTVLKKYPLRYAYQKNRLGTGHAVKVGLTEIDAINPIPSSVLVGYGDHLMFYKQDTIKNLIEIQKDQNAAIVLVTTLFDHPDELAWGRIIKDKSGHVIDIIEQKDATDKQKCIKELNAGLYCFDTFFLKNAIRKLKKSPITKEYYLTDLVKIATADKRKVIALPIPFEEVGIGINKQTEIEESEKLYSERKVIAAKPGGTR